VIDTLKDALKEFCATIDIDHVGIAGPGPYTELAEILHRRRENGHYTEFENEDLMLRYTPSLTLPDVQSVIVCLFPYYIGDQPEANLSKYTFSQDYHLVAKQKLEQIGQFLQARIPDFHYLAYTDTGPLVDRYLAYLAGLGFYGINSHIITDKYGSYMFIGYLLNNYAFTPDTPQDRTCIKCGRCVAACPGQIILGDFNINPRGCKSYLTQKKGDLTDKEIATIRKTPLIFGCDVCQDVCPHNRNVAHTPMLEFTDDIVSRLDRPDLEPLSNKEFSRRYGQHAFSWRGKKLLLRNLEYLK
jgi:epoxyqueuosine reductase